LISFAQLCKKYQPKSLSPSLPSGEGSTNSLSSLLKKQIPKYIVLISFARLRTGASALYFLVYEWIFLKENNDIDVGLGKHAF